jgi:hypothetical protein
MGARKETAATPGPISDGSKHQGQAETMNMPSKTLEKQGHSALLLLCCSIFLIKLIEIVKMPD